MRVIAVHCVCWLTTAKILFLRENGTPRGFYHAALGADSATEAAFLHGDAHIRLRKPVVELSADSPIKAPYIAYFQGALTYEHAKIALKNCLKKLFG